MKISNTQIYLLILLIILILSQVVPIILKTRTNNQNRKEDNNYKYIVSNHRLHDFHKYTKSVHLNNLEVMKKNDKQSASKTFKTSSLQSLIDKGFFVVKMLKDQAIDLSLFFSNSLKYWAFLILSKVGFFKNTFKSVLSGRLSSIHSQVIFSMIFGKIDFFDQKLSQKMKIIGMSHVMSASGYNVALIASLFSMIFNKFFLRKTRSTLVFSAVFLYCLTTSFDASIIRAFLMFSLGMLCKYVLMRQSHSLISLFISVFLMLFISPQFVSSISFQLSVAATLGIVLILPILTKRQSFNQTSFKEGLVDWSFLDQRLSKDKVNGGAREGTLGYKLTPLIYIFELMKESLFVTISAQAFSLPILMYYFHELSLMSIVSNVSLVLLVPLLTVSGVYFIFISLLINFLKFNWVLIYLTFLISKLLDCFLAAVDFFAQFEWTLIKLDSLRTWLLVLWYLIIFVMIKMRKNGFIKEKGDIGRLVCF